MELAFENLLRSVNVHEDVIMAPRIAEVTSRGLFVSIISTEEVVPSSAKDAFGIHPSVGFAHKRELGKHQQAWSLARSRRMSSRQLMQWYRLMAIWLPC